MKARHALAALSIVLVGALIWIAWPRSFTDVRQANTVSRTEHIDESRASELDGPLPELDSRSVARTTEKDSRETAAGAPSRDTAESCVVVGVVRDSASERALSGVPVAFATRRTRTDENGKFRFGALPRALQGELVIELDGYVPYSKTLETTNFTRAESVYLVRADHVLRVSVVDRDTGTDIPSASFAIDGGVVGERAATGEFVVVIADDSQIGARASAPGYCDHLWSWHVRWQEGASRISIPMIRPASIGGMVLDENRAPLEHAKVALRRRNAVDLANAEMAKWGLVGQNSRDLEVDRAFTDRRGRFQFPVVPSDDTIELFTTSGTRVRQRTTVRADTPGRSYVVDITLEPGSIIRGRVVRNGVPLMNGSVICASQSGLELANARVRKGEYELAGVPNGEMVLRLVMPTTPKAAERQEALSIASAGIYTHDLVWEEEMSTISGRVSRPDGEPVADARVDALCRTTDGREIRSKTTTSADGAFVMSVTAGLTYSLTASLGDVRTVTGIRDGVVAGSTKVDVVLPVVGRIRLSLVDAETGMRPQLDLDDAVWWRRSGDRHFDYYYFRGAAVGTCELDLPPETVDLLVDFRSHGYLPWRRMAHRVDSERVAEFEVQLVRGVSVRVELVPFGTELKAAMQDYRLFLLEESQLNSVRGPFDDDDERANFGLNDRWMWLEDDTLTGQLLMRDETGITLLRGLAPGRYFARVFPDDFEFEPASIIVNSDSTETVQLRWRRRNQ